MRAVRKLCEGCDSPKKKAGFVNVGGKQRYLCVDCMKTLNVLRKRESAKVPA